MATDFKKIVAEAKAKQAEAAAELKAAREAVQAEAAPMLEGLEASKATFDAAKEAFDAAKADYSERKKEYNELFGSGGGGGTKQKLASKRISWGKPSLVDGMLTVACVVSDTATGEKDDRGVVELAVEEGMTATALAKAAAEAFEVMGFATGGQVRGLANSIKKLLDAA